jgi:hypothetical protein
VFAVRVWPDRKIRSAARAWTVRKRGLTAKPTGRPIRPEKPLASAPVTVPHTDTGRQVEDTKARERTLVKELGNLTP